MTEEYTHDITLRESVPQDEPIYWGFDEGMELFEGDWSKAIDSVGVRLSSLFRLHDKKFVDSKKFNKEVQRVLDLLNYMLSDPFILDNRELQSIYEVLGFYYDGIEDEFYDDEDEYSPVQWNQVTIDGINSVKTAAQKILNERRQSKP